MYIQNNYTKYEDKVSAYEVPKPEVARSWENILEGKPCKLVLFLTHWPLSDTGLAGFDLGWLSSALSILPVFSESLK